MGDNIIYFDNAATTRRKPDAVYERFNNYIHKIGVSPGRGSHPLAIEASRMLYKCRKEIGKYFGCEKTNQVIITNNATEASNLFFKGFLKSGDHVVLSPYEHNAVLRPVHYLYKKGIIDYSIIPMKTTGEFCLKDIMSVINPKTKLAAITLASNITGTVIFNKILSSFFNDLGIKVFVDTAQGAGVLDIDMKEDNIDYLIFTGHKDLFGLPGVGGLCSLSPLNIEPLLHGGTGGDSKSFSINDNPPEKYESGTINMPAICSLKEGINYNQENQNVIKKKKRELFNYCIEEMKNNKSVTLYGNDSADGKIGIILFNHKTINCQEFSYKLNKSNICVRTGLHCNILGHKLLGTDKTGAVRLSFSHYNTFSEIESFINILKNEES